MRFITKKRVAAAAAAVVVAGGGMAAYAYWTGGGSGTGSGHTGTPAALTVKQTSAGTGLYPGGSVALSGNFDNPNGYSITVTSVSATVDAFTVAGTGGKPDCTEADFTITGTGSGGVVPTGNAQGSWSGLTLSMVNGAGNQDACKNVSVPITYTAS